VLHRHAEPCFTVDPRYAGAAWSLRLDGKDFRMAMILMPIPNQDFDPAEAGVPWRLLRNRGHRTVVATPDGRAGQADTMIVAGKGLGLLGRFLKADARARSAYEEMTRTVDFQMPMPYDVIRPDYFDALLLPGGHAPGMRPYLESTRLQSVVAAFFKAGKPVGAICHGVLLCARSSGADHKSVLYGRKTTGLTKKLELAARALTRLHLLNYHQTYATTIEDEVRAALASPNDFITGPASVRRDSPTKLEAGFTVRDRNYLSARWAGDVHRFAADFADMLNGR
jgi:protease I